jgi:hypothetical protein
VLQKSKVAARRIFRENPKREALADSYDLNRITEVEAAPAARRIFGTGAEWIGSK